MKTTDLIGPALDWAVGKCEEIKIDFINTRKGVVVLEINPADEDVSTHYHPSTNWARGGPLIDKARILLYPMPGQQDRWAARVTCPIEGNYMYGDTALIAAMRAYVFFTLGFEVHLPKELDT